VTSVREPTARVRGRAPLIPDYLWRWVVPVVAALALLVGAVGAWLRDVIGPRPIETRIMDAIDSWDVSRRVFRLGLEFGSPRFFAAVVIALALWAAVRRNPGELVACAAVPAAVVIVEAVLKPLVGRTWELPHSASTYPSGTAAGVAAWTALTWLFAAPAVRSAGLRVGLAITLGAVTMVTAVAVVGAHRHFPLDALGGVAVGVGTVLVTAALIDVIAGAHRQPAPAGSAATEA
jgi:membrane-associated phospholipid phosphatase